MERQGADFCNSLVPDRQQRVNTTNSCNDMSQCLCSFASLTCKLFDIYESVCWIIKSQRSCPRSEMLMQNTIRAWRVFPTRQLPLHRLPDLRHCCAAYRPGFSFNIYFGSQHCRRRLLFRCPVRNFNGMHEQKGIQFERVWRPGILVGPGAYLSELCVQKRLYAVLSEQNSYVHAPQEFILCPLLLRLKFCRYSSGRFNHAKRFGLEYSVRAFKVEPWTLHGTWLCPISSKIEASSLDPLFPHCKGIGKDMNVQNFTKLDSKQRNGGCDLGVRNFDNFTPFPYSLKYANILFMLFMTALTCFNSPLIFLPFLQNLFISLADILRE